MEQNQEDVIEPTTNKKIPVNSGILNQLLQNKDTIEVSREFLSNIKHILEVITERSSLKYNEVSQVGPVFTELDNLLK